MENIKNRKTKHPFGRAKKIFQSSNQLFNERKLKSLKMAKIPVFRSLNGSNSHSTLESRRGRKNDS